MSTGFRYINARVLLIFLIALSITVAILVGERLVHFLEKAANGSVPPKAIFLLVAFRFSELLQLVIPFVISISISISLGALQESRELLSLQVAGLSNLRLLAWLSAPVLVLTVFVGIMSILATPSARQMEESYISEYSNSQNTTTIQQGGFQKDNEWTLYHAKKPKNENKISKLLAMYSMSGNRDDLASMVDYNYNTSLITALSSVMSTDQIISFVDHIQNHVNNLEIIDSVSVTGMGVVIRDLIYLVIESSICLLYTSPSPRD